MGSYAECWLESRYVGSTKGDFDYAVMQLFRPSDKRIQKSAVKDLPKKKRRLPNWRASLHVRALAVSGSGCCQHSDLLVWNLTLVACRISHVSCGGRKFANKEHVIRHPARARRIARIHLCAIAKYVAVLVGPIILFVFQADGVHA